MLNIEHFSKIYQGRTPAVDDVSLSIAAGEIYGFIGHNGAGKTTTLKACAGILNFTQGRILLDGVSVQDDPMTYKQQIAFVPDNPDLYEFLTGIQYVTFICDVYGAPPQVRQERIRSYAEALELTGNLGDLIGSYSHGMKQKLALICALVHEPRLLILDEPFVGLDPKASFTVKQMMRDHCDKGNAIFFSTHVLEVAEKLCTKVAIIKKGRLIVSGKTEEVRGRESLEDVFMELVDHE